MLSIDTLCVGKPFAIKGLSNDRLLSRNYHTSLSCEPFVLKYTDSQQISVCTLCVSV